MNTESQGIAYGQIVLTAKDGRGRSIVTIGLSLAEAWGTAFKPFFTTTTSKLGLAEPAFDTFVKVGDTHTATVSKDGKSYQFSIVES